MAYGGLNASCVPVLRHSMQGQWTRAEPSRLRYASCREHGKGLMNKIGSSVPARSSQNSFFK